MAKKHSAGAFGEISGDGWMADDKRGRDVANPFDEPPPPLWEVLDDDVVEQILGWRATVAVDVGMLYGLLSSSAAKLILTAATNDVLSAVAHVGDLDGRSAAHAARSSFEHVVNLFDVLNSPVNTSERYEEHRFVTEEQVGRRQWYLGYLTGESRRRELRRLTRLTERAEQPLRKAMERYGSRFALGWAQGTLKDRASRYGLSDHYEGYRILSGVIHGSSGAMAGIAKNVQGAPVHRIGPDLDLAGTAYAEGLLNFLKFAETLWSATGAHEAREIRDLTAGLLELIPVVQDALRRIDRTYWPKTPPPRPLAVVAFYKGGQRRWFIHDPRAQTMTLAEPPVPEPDLSVLESAFADYDAEAFGGRPMTGMVAALQLRARADARPVPAASLLVPGDHEARLVRPRRIR